MANTKSKGLEVIKDDTLEVPAYLPGQSWDTLASGADSIMGSDLAKDELLDALIGVPFLIHKLTFRKGITRPTKDGPRQFAYVSCEAVIASAERLRKRRVDTSDLPFEPEATIVFNDGSTGIYRQVVAYLNAKGIIALPEPIVEAGGMGESSYDLPPSEWLTARAGELWFGDDGWTNYEVNVRLECPRGLRVSEYSNDYNPDGSKTRYLA